MVLSIGYVILFLIIIGVGIVGLIALYKRWITLPEYKTSSLLALVVVTLIVIPIALLVLGQYTLLAETKKVDSCATCHAMQPFVEDIHNATSLTLAARHMRNGYLGDAKSACYQCHVGPGFKNAVEAKLDGFRHLMKTVTNTYSLPITFKKTQSNENCLRCHADTPKFKAKPLHTQNMEALQSGKISCLNCHGPAHPERSTRSK